MTQIDELVIRIPGMNPEESSRLGKEVAQRIAEALPDGMGNHQLHELKIQIGATALNSETSTAEAIAAEIVMQIKLATL